MRNHAWGIFALVFVCLLAVTSSCYAWLDTGHKIVAMIAWEDLTPKTKAAITDLLKKHPRYKEDLLAGAADGATDDQLAEHAFVVAATWPDMIRSKDHPMTAKFNHPAWHYIDIPFEHGAAATTQESKAPGPHNVVEALTQTTAELRTAGTTDDAKAIDLCWIEHLVGDIHQPLHACTEYSQQFPHGDQGGNADVVLRDPPYADSKSRLHLIWDSLPGDFASESIDQYVAAGIRADAKLSREKFADKLTVADVSAWAQESHQLAVEVAYQNGELKVLESSSKLPANAQTIPGLPEGYLHRAEEVAMQRIALAGYRLADTLNATFDPK